VLFEFVLDDFGKIKDIQLIKGLNPALNNEAMRVLNKMPDWKPGKLDGKFVWVSYRIPFKFTLD
jgi:protein TonB